ncbi:hypothetical protein CC79DRAFT_1324984 [Sarocladium strictum]
MAGFLKPENTPRALQVDEVLEQITKDDQEEWEYEYSSTETEIFYLTVDLSHPDFKGKQEKITNYSRGGYYKAKPVANIGIDDAAKSSAAQTAQEHDDEHENDDADMGDDEDHGRQQSAIRRRDKGKGVDRGSPVRLQEEVEAEDNGGALEDIQILDLHSHHPIISYRGRFFEGDWSEMIGTELIFEQRDQHGNDPSNPPLPALRNLADGIDLLAASSSKILTREKILKPLVKAEDTERKKALDAVKKEWNIRIPLTKKEKEGQKGAQARFLENLMALKKKKGETDDVTIYARPAGEQIRGNPAKKSRAESQAKEKRATRRRMRNSGPRWNRSGIGLLAGRRADADNNAGEGESLSTPTPLRWGDLMTPNSEAVSKGRRESNADEDARMSG